jgi:RNA polymerase sigma-70 factor (ECF subfamily)
MDPAITGLGDRDLRAHMAWLRRLAARLVSPGGADDAVQDALLAAVEHPPALDRDVRPWLARVLVNRVHDARRTEARRRAREAAALAIDVDGPPGADQLLERHEAARMVARLVSELREPHRTLVLLRFAEGVAPIDIARSRGVPEGTVRRQLKEAVDQLRAGVAAHYGGDRRDWRMALVPLTGVSPGRAARLWKGALWMSAKTKTRIGLAAVAALLLLLVIVRTRRDPGDGIEAVIAAGADGAGDHTRSTPSAPGSLAPAPPPSAAAAPPQFAAGAAATEPPDCETKLARLRALANARADVSPEAFKVAKSSPATQQRAVQFVERALASVPVRPTYHLECRVSICRVGVITDDEALRDPPAWLHTLEQDPMFGPVRGEDRGTRLESMPTSEALTGRLVAQHWLYFSMPAIGAEEHPLETSAAAATCGERLVALQRALDAEHRREERNRGEDSARLRRFSSAPPDPELTQRVTEALKGLLSADGGLHGTWDCRIGVEDCRWQGPARLLRGVRPGHVGEALAAHGVSDDVAILVMNDTSDPNAEVDLTLRFNARRDRGAAEDR